MRAATFPVRACCIAALSLFAAACGGSPSSARHDAGDARARREAAPATVHVAAFPSITRLTPLTRTDDPDATGRIDLDAMAGEREAGQLIAWSTTGSPRVVLEPSSLRAAGSAHLDPDRIHVYIEQPMRVERGSPAGRQGTYVDPLLPAHRRDVALADDARLLAWVDVDVPASQTPGSYVGTVRVRRADRDGRAVDGDDGILARLPLRVRVRAVQLPTRPFLQSHVGLDASQLARFEHVRAGSAKQRTVVDRYAAELAQARLSVGDVGGPVPGALPGASLDRAEDARLARIFDRRGVASVRIPFYLDYPFADPLGRDRPAALAYLRSAARWVRRHGWTDRAYVFAFDEPDDADAGAVREFDELLRQADPSLRQLVTREASARAFAGSGVDIWAPNVNPDRLHPADITREARRGTSTWWYPSVTTYAPYPDLFIDELRPAPRALGWLAWRLHVRGVLYWSATHWQEVRDPWRDSATYNEPDVTANGDGVLLYPGGPVGRPGHPMPSVRLLQLRDGIDDYDLLTMATCAGTPADRTRIAAAARRVAPAIDRIDPPAAAVAAMRRLALDVLERAGDPRRCRTA